MAAVASALRVDGAGLARQPCPVTARQTAGHCHDGRELGRLVVVAATAAALAAGGLLRRGGRVAVALADTINLSGFFLAMGFQRPKMLLLQ